MTEDEAPHTDAAESTEELCECPNCIMRRAAEAILGTLIDEWFQTYVGPLTDSFRANVASARALGGELGDAQADAVYQAATHTIATMLLNLGGEHGVPDFRASFHLSGSVIKALTTFMVSPIVVIGTGGMEVVEQNAPTTDKVQ